MPFRNFTRQHAVRGVGWQGVLDSYPGGKADLPRYRATSTAKMKDWLLAGVLEGAVLSTLLVRGFHAQR